MGIIKVAIQQERPAFIKKCLCLGLTYIILHTHNLDTNNSLVRDLIQQFSANPDDAICLLYLLRYMASECEDEGIVIEESLRESYFEYIDQICDIVFKEVYDEWAGKILANAQ